ncbi:MAG: hypothetical protein IKE43_09320 [Coriobacteriales bacterium]|nr:hypothetical protein [Coriobacteriales bacterium]
MKTHPKRLLRLVAVLACFVLAFALPAWVFAEESSLDDCTSCHTAEKDSFDADSYITLAADHPAFESLCTACHSTDDTGFARVHKKTEGKKMPTKLSRTKALAEDCNLCHEKEDLVKATEDKLIKDATHEINPHDLPSNEDHDAINCFSCHVFHAVGDANAVKAKDTQEDKADTADKATTDSKATSTTDQKASASAASEEEAVNPVLANTLKNAKAFCLDCHHAGVFECGTCH